MNAKQLFISTATMLSLLATSSGLERSTPAQQPVEKKTAQPQPLPSKRKQPLILQPQGITRRPFLGVYGRPISPLLRTHLNLTAGTGIVLEHVAPASPAAQAGLKQYDIITSVAGRKIGSQNDLKKAILAQKPNAQVELKFISAGKEITKNVRLGSIIVRQNPHPTPRPAIPHQPFPKMGANNFRIPEEVLEGFPPEQRKLIMQLINGEVITPQPTEQQLKQLFKKMDISPQGMLLDMKDLFQDLNSPIGDVNSKVKMMDPQGSISIESNNGNKTIEIRNANGKLQYRGPYNTPQDKLQIPANLRSRVQALGIEEMLNLNSGNPQQQLPPLPLPRKKQLPLTP